jgi:uncharacterized protein
MNSRVCILLFGVSGAIGTLGAPHIAIAQAVASSDQAVSTVGAGNAYLLGKFPISEDPVAALTLYQKAVDRGDLNAMNNLAICYIVGLGVARDYRQAADYLRKAADAGSAIAALNLGILYETGKADRADPVTAMNWYLRAAAAGSGAAKRNIGSLYERGLGIPQNDVAAKQWYRAAASDPGAFDGLTPWGFYLGGISAGPSS